MQICQMYKWMDYKSLPCEIISSPSVTRVYSHQNLDPPKRFRTPAYRGEEAFYELLHTLSFKTSGFQMEAIDQPLGILTKMYLAMTGSLGMPGTGRSPGDSY